MSLNKLVYIEELKNKLLQSLSTVSRMSFDVDVNVKRQKLYLI